MLLLAGPSSGVHFIAMAIEETPHLHEGRVAVLAGIAQADLESDDALRILAQIARQIANKSTVRAVAAAAGYEAVNFSFNRDLEVYFDLHHGEKDVGYIAKGWADPGFRVGEIVFLPGPVKRTGKWIDDLRDYCAVHGIAATLEPSADGVEIKLEFVLYSEGFNTAVFAGALDSLRNCRRKVELKQQQLIGASLSAE